VQTAREAATSASHVPPCSALDYDVPPSSGTHYSQWAAFGTYEQPVPWGFLVHALEHGAIVLAYRCDAGADCTEIRETLQAIVDARPRDSLCRDEVPIRYVLAPAPEKLAYHSRSSSPGPAGYSRSPPGSGRPASGGPRPRMRQPGA
jgi:hypothetical protein